MVRITNTEQTSKIVDMLEEIEAKGVQHGFWLGVFTKSMSSIFFPLFYELNFR